MFCSMSLQEKQSEGWVGRLKQLRGGGENDPDEIMKTPASKKNEDPITSWNDFMQMAWEKGGSENSFTMDQLHYSRKRLDVNSKESK